MTLFNRFAEKLYRANPLNKKMITMDISSDDVQNLLEGLNRFQVKYLLVGGMAGATARAKDLADLEELQRVWEEQNR